MSKPTTTRPIALLGSSGRDLPSRLSEALEVCQRLGLIPVMVEHPAADAAGAAEAVEAALSLVDEADVYVGLFGHAYGYIPPGFDKSLSEMEYDRALESGIPRLIFATSQDQSQKPVETRTTEDTVKLKAFIDRVKEKQIVGQVDSPEFRARLTDGLKSLGIRSETRRGSRPPRKLGGGDGSAKDELRKKGGGDGTAKMAQPRKKGGGVGDAIGAVPIKKGGSDGSAKDPAMFAANKLKDVLRVFVASPRDVQDERSRMPKVIESLNKTLGKLLNVVIELWRWEVDAPPAVGEPQALVDPELDEADVVLVIFWNRFGSLTSVGVTGTQGEVLRSVKRWKEGRRPQVMIYFCQRPARLDRAEMEQRLKLLDFRESISSLVLAVEYEQPQEFEWRVRDDLFLTISTLCVQHR